MTMNRSSQCGDRFLLPRAMGKKTAYFIAEKHIKKTTGYETDGLSSLSSGGSVDSGSFLLLRTCRYQRLACVITFILRKVLDKSGGQIVCL